MPVKSLLDEAQNLSTQGRLVEAEALYTEVLRRRPNAVEGLLGLGAVAYHQGRTAEAVSLFARAVAVSPLVPTLHSNLGEALRVLKRLDDANGHVSRALDLDPTLPDSWNTKGLIAHDRGQFAEAEAAYREGIRLRPQFVAAHVNLGNSLLECGRQAEAVETLRSGAADRAR